MKTKLKITAAIICSLITVICLSACFSPWKGDEGTFTISFGGGGNARAANNNRPEWAPNEELTYLVTVSGGRGPELKDEPVKESETKTFSVVPGVWLISVKANKGYQDEKNKGQCIAEGFKTEEIESGLNNTVVIPMKRVYLIGDVGPAGGIVFYDAGKIVFCYDDEGKPVSSNDWRYLEVASEDEQYGEDDEEIFPWIPDLSNSPDIDIKTSRTIGEGKANTVNILFWAEENRLDDENFAANIIKKNHAEDEDWFLPSYFELSLMRNIFRDYEDDLSFKGFEKEKYWSSTRAYNSSDNALYVDFDDNPESDWNKGIIGDDERTSRKHRVRAIRAFKIEDEE